MKNKIIRTIFLCWFLAPALYLTVITLRPVILGFSSANWPFTEGHILTSELKSDNSTSNSPTRFGAPPAYREVAYEYEVHGHRYTSNRIAFIRLFEKREENTIPYSPGQTVRVYYNPKNPAISSLRVTTNRVIAGGLIFPVASLSFCMICIWLIIRTWVQKK